MDREELPLRRIYLIDDDADLLRQVGRLLRISGFDVSLFASPRDFLQALPGALPGCVITDLKMPEMSGHALIEAMEEAGSTLPVIFLTGAADIADSVLAMKRGAINFLTKPATRDSLLAAIGEAFSVLDSRLHHESEIGEYRRRFNLLTPREKEVCLKIAQGSLNKQAAGDLGISEKTVKVHRARVMQKLMVNSVAELVRVVDRLAG